MNVFNIARTFQLKKEKGWDTIYFVIDLHGTLVKPGHDHFDFYPYALEVIEWLNNRKDIKIILWSSSHDSEIQALREELKKYGIHLDFVNENPLEANTNRANFSKKFYFNVLLDDKAGMTPESDWKLIKDELIRLGEWK
jgi:succinylglutamate desuccinylase